MTSNRVSELLVEAQKEHDEEVALLHMVVSTLALMPELIERTKHQIELAYISGDGVSDLDQQLAGQKEALRVAKLYGNGRDFDGIPTADFIQFLSDGLA